ncbi:MAG TPA: hypothetical protein VNQ79_22470 [Blastocatellia bacterium]|nr:hypothetical protein [Blastocatellia bacterium]
MSREVIISSVQAERDRDLGFGAIVALFEGPAERRTRRFYPLELERDKVAFFPLSWTVVHPISEDSPLWQKGPAELAAMDAEFLILLTGIDETFSQTVHARSSYRHDEIVWNQSSATFTTARHRPAR